MAGPSSGMKRRSRPFAIVCLDEAFLTPFGKRIANELRKLGVASMPFCNTTGRVGSRSAAPRS